MYKPLLDAFNNEVGKYYYSQRKEVGGHLYGGIVKCP